MLNTEHKQLRDNLNLSAKKSLALYSVGAPILSWIINAVLTKITGEDSFNALPGLVLLWIHYQFIKDHLQNYKGDQTNIYMPTIVTPILNSILLLVHYSMFSLGKVVTLAGQKFDLTPFMLGMVAFSTIGYFIATKLAINSYNKSSSR